MASGNGKPEICADNLLKTVRGEVPMDRIRGVDSELTDRPLSAVAEEMTADAEWVIETWEPRVEVNDVTAIQDAETGHVLVRADLSVNMDEDEEEPEDE